MRIISGAARGHKLKTAAGDTRPATDRTREAVFSLLGDHVRDTRILDLFSGTGAYGLEALSRGGRQADFVDQSRRVVAVLRGNADHAAFAQRTTIHCRSVASALELLARGSSQCFDMVFADPPYEMSRDRQSLEIILPVGKLLPLLARGGFVILERSADSEALDFLTATGELEILTSRCYGKSRIEIFRQA